MRGKGSAMFYYSPTDASLNSRLMVVMTVVFSVDLLNDSQPFCGNSYHLKYLSIVLDLYQVLVTFSWTKHNKYFISLPKL